MWDAATGASYQDDALKDYVQYLQDQYRSEQYKAQLIRYPCHIKARVSTKVSQESLDVSAPVFQVPLAAARCSFGVPAVHQIQFDHLPSLLALNLHVVAF